MTRTLLRGAHLGPCLLLFVAGVLGTASLEAQWRIGLGLAKESTHGFARGLGVDRDRSFLPYRPLVWTLRGESPGTRVRAALEARYATPDLALTTPEATVVVHEGVTTVAGVRPAAVLDIARLSGHALLRAEAGPLLEIWSFEGDDARTRLSVEGGLGLAVDLGGRFGALVNWTGSLMPTSPFKGTGVEQELKARPGWRWGLRGLLMYRP